MVLQKQPKHTWNKFLFKNITVNALTCFNASRGILVSNYSTFMHNKSSKAIDYSSLLSSGRLIFVTKNSIT